MRWSETSPPRGGPQVEGGGAGAPSPRHDLSTRAPGRGTLRVGDCAPRFVSDGHFPWNAGRRATLAEVRQIGDVVLLRYALSPRFRDD